MNHPTRQPRPWLLPALVVALVVVGVAIWLLRTMGPAPLVVYCAHDAQYARPIIEQFERETGIKVELVTDTEASKALGLTQRILAEKDNPRCDVFWNNQELGTMDLAAAGVLAPYKGEGYARIPDAYKDADGRWTGFAARLRVWIINTDKMDATREAVRAAAQAQDLSQLAIARPLFGTTRTHYTVLWEAWGGDTLQAWHKDYRDRGVIELTGNATVMRQVAAGNIALGLTDTDDFFVAKDDGKPVAMLPTEIGDLETDDQRRTPQSRDREGAESNADANQDRQPLPDGRGSVSEVVVIPNTVAMIKGTQRSEDAKRLIEFLLSRENELTLAKSKARQIPLGEVDEVELPEDVKQLAEWAQRGYPLHKLDDARQACLDWLRSEYAK